jgi:hypothetical protein
MVHNTNAAYNLRFHVLSILILSKRDVYLNYGKHPFYLILKWMKHETLNYSSKRDVYFNLTILQL